MYATKYPVNRLADKGPLSINTAVGGKKGDPYDKPRANDPSDSRYRGRQFGVSPKKKPGNIGDGTFSTIYQAPSGYSEKIRYLKAPRHKGFGSGDASKRDEFSTNIAIGIYREAIGSEIKTAKAAAAKLLQEQPQDSCNSNQDAQARPEESKAEELFMYDQVFNVEEDKTVGKSRRGKTIKLGSLRTSTSGYGIGCESPSRKGNNGRTSVTQKFFNSGHLTVGETE